MTDPNVPEPPTTPDQGQGAPPPGVNPPELIALDPPARRLVCAALRAANWSARANGEDFMRGELAAELVRAEATFIGADIEAALACLHQVEEAKYPEPIAGACLVVHRLLPRAPEPRGHGGGGGGALIMLHLDQLGPTIRAAGGDQSIRATSTEPSPLCGQPGGGHSLRTSGSARCAHCGILVCVYCLGDKPDALLERSDMPVHRGCASGSATRPFPSAWLTPEGAAREAVLHLIHGNTPQGLLLEVVEIARAILREAARTGGVTPAPGLPRICADALVEAEVLEGVPAVLLARSERTYKLTTAGMSFVEEHGGVNITPSACIPPGPRFGRGAADMDATLAAAIYPQVLEAWAERPLEEATWEDIERIVWARAFRSPELARARAADAFRLESGQTETAAKIAAEVPLAQLWPEILRWEALGGHSATRRAVAVAWLSAVAALEKVPMPVDQLPIRG